MYLACYHRKDDDVAGLWCKFVHRYKAQRRTCGRLPLEAAGTIASMTSDVVRKDMKDNVCRFVKSQSLQLVAVEPAPDTANDRI